MGTVNEDVYARVARALRTPGESRRLLENTHLGDLCMKKALLWLVAGTLVYGITLGTASARPKYKTEFDNLYVKEGAPQYSEALVKALPDGKSNCNVCHVGKDKKVRNDYGKAVGKFTGKDQKDVAMIKEALEKAAAEKSGSTTFGNLIKEGKLPITP
jgi:hypothetical protein